MPDQLANLGSFFSGPSGKGLFSLAGIGSGIAGTVDNALQQNQYSNAQGYLKNIITNPTAYNQAVQQYTQPLNQGLVTGVENATNAQLAERGLGSSGAITQSVLAQALAPYIQQNQQAGAQALQSSLGMIGQLKPTGQNSFTDISKLLASMKGAAPGTPGFNPASLLVNPNLSITSTPSTGFLTPDAGGTSSSTWPTPGGAMPDLSAFGDVSMPSAFAVPFV